MKFDQVKKNDKYMYWAAISIQREHNGKLALEITIGFRIRI